MRTKNRTLQLLLDSLSFLIFGFVSCAGMALFVFILCSVFAFAKTELNWNFISLPTAQAGLTGGIRYQIFGSIILVFTAALIVSPLSFSIAILENFILKNKLAAKFIASALQLLNATPSILFGIIGFKLFVKQLELQKSWLAGAAVLSLMILPTVTTAISIRLKSIPNSYIEQAKSMGFCSEDVIRKILIPYSWGGLLTGLVLGISRAIGETAPIMLTAVVFSGATIPNGIIDNPVLALPYHIFSLTQEMNNPLALSRAWATSFVLLSFVIITSFCAFYFRKRSHEEAK